VLVPLVLRQFNLGLFEIDDGVTHFFERPRFLRAPLMRDCFGYSGSLVDFDLDLSAPDAQVTTMRSTLTARVKIRFMA
jgi:hypothetical protein